MTNAAKCYCNSAAHCENIFNCTHNLKTIIFLEKLLRKRANRMTETKIQNQGAHTHHCYKRKIIWLNTVGVTFFVRREL